MRVTEAQDAQVPPRRPTKAVITFCIGIASGLAVAAALSLLPLTFGSAGMSVVETASSFIIFGGFGGAIAASITAFSTHSRLQTIAGSAPAEVVWREALLGGYAIESPPEPPRLATYVLKLRRHMLWQFLSRSILFLIIAAMQIQTMVEGDGSLSSVVAPYLLALLIVLMALVAAKAIRDMRRLRSLAANIIGSSPQNSNRTSVQPDHPDSP